MHIITQHELSQICVNQIIIYLRKSRAERNETVEEVLARHEKILQDYAEQTFGTKIPEANIYREVVSGETLDERIEIKKIFNRLENEPIRALSITGIKLLDSSGVFNQASFFDIEEHQKHEKEERLELARDKIRKKYGLEKLTRCSLMENDFGI